MGNRHRGRELAFQILYQMDIGKQNLDDVFSRFLTEEKGLPQVKEFAKVLAQGAWEKRELIDEALSKQAKNWSLERFSAVDRAILRLGAYELIYREDIPAEVSLNECIELAKEFGGDESPKFVNGVLDQVRKENPQAKPENHPAP